MMFGALDVGGDVIGLHLDTTAFSGDGASSSLGSLQEGELLREFSDWCSGAEDGGFGVDACTGTGSDEPLDR